VPKAKGQRRYVISTAEFRIKQQLTHPKTSLEDKKICKVELRLDEVSNDYRSRLYELIEDLGGFCF
jgi:hypothetical protein